MRVLLYYFMAVLLFSCGGAPTKKKSYKDAPDFKAKTKVSKRYNRARDRFSLGKVEQDALIAESLNRVPGKLASRVANENDPISQIIGNCYRRNFDDAFEIADENYESYKNNPAYWNQIGSCYLLRDEQKKASIYYNKARALNKWYVPVVNNIGVIYLKMGKDHLALRQFKKALKTNPAAKTPRFNRANIYLRYGLYQKACPIFIALNKRTLGDPDVVNALGVCNLLKRRYRSAVEVYKKMDSDFYERPYIGINYALALKLAGNKNSAKEILEDVDTNNLGTMKSYHQAVKKFIDGGRK